MKTALDTNVLSAMWSGEASSVAMATAIGQAWSAGGLVICGVVFAELIASPKTTEDFVSDYLKRRNIDIEFQFSDRVWTEAGRRFGRQAQRRKVSAGNEPRRLLADYLIGAHALIHAERLMTLDPRRYQQDFPELKLYPINV